MATPDGAWRVEIVTEGTRCRYRLVHGGTVTDVFAIATLERLLAAAGLSSADLVEITP